MHRGSRKDGSEHRSTDAPKQRAPRHRGAPNASLLARERQRAPKHQSWDLEELKPSSVVTVTTHLAE